MPTRPVRRPLTFDELVDRARREFQALPGLRLTQDQACRLWSLTPAECEALRLHLIDAQFLARTDDGSLLRADLRAQVHLPRSAALPSFRRSA